jgi:hypothetical protein
VRVELVGSLVYCLCVCVCVCVRERERERERVRVTLQINITQGLWIRTDISHNVN